MLKFYSAGFKKKYSFNTQSIKYNWTFRKILWIWIRRRHRDTVIADSPSSLMTCCLLLVLALIHSTSGRTALPAYCPYTYTVTWGYTSSFLICQLEAQALYSPCISCHGIPLLFFPFLSYSWHLKSLLPSGILVKWHQIGLFDNSVISGATCHLAAQKALWKQQKDGGGGHFKLPNC